MPLFDIELSIIYAVNYWAKRGIYPYFSLLFLQIETEWKEGERKESYEYKTTEDLYTGEDSPKVAENE